MRALIPLIAGVALASAAAAQRAEPFWRVEGDRAVKLTVRGRVVSKVEFVELEEFREYLRQTMGKDVAPRPVAKQMRVRTGAPPSTDGSRPRPAVVLSDDGVRGTRWAMSPEQVAEAVPGVQFQEGASPPIGTLRDEIVGRPGLVSFLFVGTELAEVVVAFDGDLSRKQTTIDSFEELTVLLTEKYGEPDRDDEIWHKDVYRNDRGSWGFALSRGDFEHRVEWSQGSTRIMLELTGGNYEVNLQLRYESRSHFIKRQAAQLKNKLEDL